MDWFVKKVYHRLFELSQYRCLTGLQGGLVEEEKPVSLTYQRTRKTSHGRFNSVDIDIYFSSDPLNSGAPKYVTDCKSLIQIEVFTGGTHQDSSWCDEFSKSEGGPEQNPNQPPSDEEGC